MRSVESIRRHQTNNVRRTDEPEKRQHNNRCHCRRSVSHIYFRVPFISARAAQLSFRLTILCVERWRADPSDYRRSHRAQNAVAIIRLFLSLENGCNPMTANSVPSQYLSDIVRSTNKLSEILVLI